MKYSQATDYALHAMLYMVTVASDKPVGVQLLAEKLGVSQTYLSKMMTKLVKAGLIQSALMVLMVVIVSDASRKKSLFWILSMQSKERLPFLNAV